jgi:pimeloyl-ACP methyl ester carboxylesterase
MAGFPCKDVDRTFNGPTLFIRGSNSHYVSDATLPSIQRFFPNFKLTDVEAGHWVMAENPEAFKQGISTIPPGSWING